jgi:serine/threonine-protein kinase
MLKSTAGSGLEELGAGRVLGTRFRIVRAIGRGRTSVVYEAEQLDLRRLVAVKVVDLAERARESGEHTRPPDLDGSMIVRVEGTHVVAERLDADAGLCKCFQQEASMVARLEHPNIVVVHEFGLDAGACYIAMELVSGRTLADLVRDEGPCVEARIVAIGVQICEALEVAHQSQLIHRDIKPSNILVTTRGRAVDLVKVVDFGVGKLLGPQQSGTASEVGIVGTPSYLAPEQALGEALSAATDIYAVGGVMHFLATGRPPFDRAGASATIAAHLSEPPMPLRQAAGANPISEDLERIVERCLAKDPTDRFATAAELADALRAASRGGERRAGARSVPTERRWIAYACVVAAAAVLLGVVVAILLARA